MNWPVVITLGIIVLSVMAVLLWGGWVLTRKIRHLRFRIFLRSGVIGTIFAPSLLAAGHGGRPAPAFLAILFYLFSNHKEYAFYWGVIPIISLWFIVFVIWIVIFEIQKAWNRP